MFKTINNGDVMNNSNHLHREIKTIKNQLTELNTEENDFILLMKEKQDKLFNKMREIIKNDFPIKEGDEVITKKKYEFFRVYQTGKTYRSIKHLPLYEDYVKGKVKIYPQDELGRCRIEIKQKYQENIVNNLNGCDYGVSLEQFNELFQVIKNK